MSTKDQVKNLLAPKIKTAVILNKAELFELANNSQKQSKHEFDELKHSIRKNGFDETLLVRPVDGRYEVVSGNHRYRAGIAEGMTEFPCVVQEWDDTEASIESVRRNYVRGKIDKNLFTEQVNTLLETSSMDLEDVREQMGFEDEDALAALYQDRAQDEEDFVSDVAKDALSPPAVRILEDLGNILATILAEYGATVPNSFIVFPAGNKHHIYIAANSSLKSAVTAIAERSVEKGLDINVSLGGILQIGLAQTDFLSSNDTSKVDSAGSSNYGEGSDLHPVHTSDEK